MFGDLLEGFIRRERTSNKETSSSIIISITIAIIRAFKECLLPLNLWGIRCRPSTRDAPGYVGQWGVPAGAIWLCAHPSPHGGVQPPLLQTLNEVLWTKPPRSSDVAYVMEPGQKGDLPQVFFREPQRLSEMDR